MELGLRSGKKEATAIGALIHGQGQAKNVLKNVK
jgi:hypothetical protein